jgi:hypothetical protein
MLPAPARMASRLLRAAAGAGLVRAVGASRHRDSSARGSADPRAQLLCYDRCGVLVRVGELSSTPVGAANIGSGQTPSAARPSPVPS